MCDVDSIANLTYTKNMYSTGRSFNINRIES